MDILTKFKNLLIESLKDNKKLIIGLYVLFIAVFILAWVLSASRISADLVNTTYSAGGVIDTFDASDALELFIHNGWGGIVTYVASVFFAIPAIVSLLYNAVNLGLLGQFFTVLVPNGGVRYIVYLIPHGIFEITATVMQSAAGIVLFLFIWRFIRAWRSSETQGASEAFEKTKGILIQSIALMIFSMILLIIAAPIEAYVSVPFSELLFGPVSG